MAFAGMKQQTQSSLSEINVTPLVDVVLVLLVIFMVTAPILQTGIEVNLPQTRSVSNIDPEQRAVITIGREEILYYGSSPLNFNELGARLKADIPQSKDSINMRIRLEFQRSGCSPGTVVKRHGSPWFHSTERGALLLHQKLFNHSNYVFPFSEEYS